MSGNRLVVMAAACAVVVWRVTALTLVYVQGDSSGGVLLIQTFLAIAGATFLVCGLWVFSRISGKASLLFAGFCICSGLHWGGPLDIAPGQLRTGLILFYLLVSSVLGSIFLLQFTLRFPRESRFAASRPFVRLLYLPVLAATALAAVYLVSPSGSSLRATAVDLFMLLHEIVSNLFAVVAIAFLASHLLRAGLTRAQKRYVGLMVAGMLTAWLPYLVASAVGVDTDPWNLTVVALPISFAIALFGMETAGETSRA